MSLETKWDLVKHNVSKICGTYGAILALNQNLVCSENA
jgi:hypothetical protein